MQPLPSTQSFRVVIPVVAGVGNALLAVPMVRQLKRARPGARITVIARIDAMAEAFRRMPEVDEALVTGNGVRGILKRVWWTWRRRHDVYLVPFPSNRWQYNLLALVSGARTRVMHAFAVGRWRAMGFVPARRVPALRGVHDVEQNLRLLGALGIEADLEAAAPRFVVNEQDRARARGLLEHAGVHANAPFVAVHAGSGRTVLGKAKRWPPAKWAQLLARFRGEFPHHVVLLEGPDEAGVADEILRELDDTSGVSAVRLTGPLGDAAAVLERAKLYVGSDSGLAHLAAAVGTKAVTIFAPADPDRVCPFGQRDLVVRPEKDCSPCFQYPWRTPYPKMMCREPYCVSEVRSDDVLDAVKRALAPMRVLVPSPSGGGLG